MFTRTTAIARTSNRLDASLTPTVQQYAEMLAQNIVRRASEFASHCGRQRVQLYDVTAASSLICTACSSYDAKSNTIRVYGPTRKSSPHRSRGRAQNRQQRHVGGGMPPYPNYCGTAANRSQCTGGRAVSCISNTRIVPITPANTPPVADVSGQAGGSTRRARRPPRCIMCGTASTASTASTAFTASTSSRTRRTHGGAPFAYTGFCGGTPFLTQCAFSESVGSSASGALCYGGRARTRTGPRSRRTHRARRGGTPAVFAFPNGVVFKSIVRETAHKHYKVQWTPDALTYLDRALSFHLGNVLNETNTRVHGKVNSRSLGATSSALPALTRVMQSYGYGDHLKGI